MYDESTRVSLYRTLCISRLLHNAGTWANLPRPQAARLAKAYARPLRTIYGLWKDRDGQWISDSHVLSIAA
eukprot:10023245-Lingulodinium_polyedra.AAC.1